MGWGGAYSATLEPKNKPSSPSRNLVNHSAAEPSNDEFHRDPKSEKGRLTQKPKDTSWSGELLEQQLLSEKLERLPV